MLHFAMLFVTALLVTVALVTAAFVGKFIRTALETEFVGAVLGTEYVSYGQLNLLVCSQYRFSLLL